MLHVETSRLRGLARDLFQAGLLYGGGAAAGFVVLVGLFKVGLFAGIDILFYRGIVLTILAMLIVGIAVAMAAARLGWGGVRDGLAAAALSAGLNLSFVVVAPVTVDRSISVFILASMAAAPDRTVTARDVEATFRSVYLERLHQIDRRMIEQVRTGNVVEVAPGSYKITKAGEAFIRTATAVAWLFDTDRKLLDAPRDHVRAAVASTSSN
jgi:hypothetical protein